MGYVGKSSLNLILYFKSFRKIEFYALTHLSKTYYIESFNKFKRKSSIMKAYFNIYKTWRIKRIGFKQIFWVC
jgi:hypothetical protein